MGTIKDYIANYGKYTFLEKEFNEVDNAIFSSLSYVDFEGIVPGIGEKGITLKEAAELFYKKFTKKEILDNILAVREASLSLKTLAESNRYKDLILLNYEYIVSNDIQFGAICIKLPDKTMYVSYEGTDSYVSGWKEDFMLYSVFPLKSQKEAIKYLNKVVGIFGPRVYVGGHSKGGNLALVAAMYCRTYIIPKIIKIYSNDGPGLRLKEISSYRYSRIQKRYVHIMPEEGFIGILLCNEDKHLIVKSKNKKFFQHDINSWIVDGDHFVKGRLSQFSIRCRNAIDNWLSKNDEDKMKKFVTLLFEAFKQAEIEDLMEIKHKKFKNILKIYKNAKNLDNESEKLISTCFKELYQEWRS